MTETSIKQQITIVRVNPHTGLVRCRPTDIELFFPLQPAVWGTLEVWREGHHRTATISYYHETRRPASPQEMDAAVAVLRQYELQWGVKLVVRDNLPAKWQEKRKAL